MAVPNGLRLIGIDLEQHGCLERRPLAHHPIADEMFPEVTHWREAAGEIKCWAFFETSVLESHTLVLKASDPVADVAELVKNYRYTYEASPAS